MDQAVVYLIRMFIRMIPGEYAKKMMLKAIPAAAEISLKRSADKETLKLLPGETDYCLVVLPRKDQATGRFKILIIEAAGSFNVKPYPIRPLTMFDVGNYIENADFEKLKEKIKASLKDGSLEDTLKEINN